MTGMQNGEGELQLLTLGGDGDLGYYDTGHGETIVLVHEGVFSDWFRPLSRQLPRNRFRVVRTRRSGYRGSAPPGRHLGLADHARHAGVAEGVDDRGGHEDGATGADGDPGAAGEVVDLAVEDVEDLLEVPVPVRELNPPPGGSQESITPSCLLPIAALTLMAGQVSPRYKISLSPGRSTADELDHLRRGRPIARCRAGRRWCSTRRSVRAHSGALVAQRDGQGTGARWKSCPWGWILWLAVVPAHALR